MGIGPLYLGDADLPLEAVRAALIDVQFIIIALVHRHSSFGVILCLGVTPFR